MTNFILNGAPYRTKPDFIQSRLNNQSLPGPVYGNRVRLADNIRTTRGGEWMPLQAKSKLYPNLRGLGQDDPNTVGVLKNARKLVQRAADAEANEVQGLKKTIDYLLGTGKYNANTIETSHPDLLRAWRDAGSLYGSLMGGIQNIDRLIKQAPSEGWSKEDVDLASQITNEYNANLAKLSAQERSEAGLSGAPLIILAIGISLALIALAAGMTNKPDPIDIANRKIAARNKILSDPNLSNTEKAAATKIIDGANPEESSISKFFGSLGLAVGIFAIGFFVIKSGLLGGLAARIGKGPGRGAKARERYEEAYYTSATERLGGKPRAARAYKPKARKGRKKTRFGI